MNQEIIVQTNTAVVVSQHIYDEFDRLVSEHLEAKKPSSIPKYQRVLNSWRSFCLAHEYMVLAPERNTVLEWIQERELTVNTMKQEISIMRGFMRRLIRQTTNQEARNGIDNAIADISDKELANVLPKLENVRKSNHQKGFRLSQSDVSDLFNRFSENNALHARNRALFAVLLSLGIRKQELQNIKWENINLDTGMVKIKRAKKRAQINPDEEPPLKLSVNALAHVRDWHSYYPDSEYVFIGLDKGHSPRNTDKPMSSKAIYDLCVFNNGERFKPHDLRRTFISDAFAANTPLAVIQKWVGHSSPHTTMRYLSEERGETLATAMKRTII